MDVKLCKSFPVNIPTFDSASATEVLMDDVLILVLELLDEKSLKQAALVCKR